MSTVSLPSVFIRSWPDNLLPHQAVSLLSTAQLKELSPLKTIDDFAIQLFSGNRGDAFIDIKSYSALSMHVNTELYILYDDVILKYSSRSSVFTV